MIAAQNQSIHRKKQRYIMAVSKLDAMSPLKVLTRGYAMAQNGEGTVVRSVNQVTAGDQLMVSVSDGTIQATVNEIKEGSR